MEFTDERLRKIEEDARAHDPEKADLAHALVWARETVDEVRDNMTALAREARRVFPVLCFTVEGDGTMVERVTEPLRAMINELLDGSKVEPMVAFDGGSFVVTKSHCAARNVAESFRKTTDEAPNFTTMVLTTPDGDYRVTVTKPSGESPTEIISKLKAEIEAMKHET